MSRPRTKPLPHIAELHYRYIYDPETGTFTHRRREGPERLVKGWNLRYAGKLAGTVQNGGYWFLNIGGNCLLGHRVAWAMTHGAWPGELDHRDGNKLNNAIGNLRPATHQQNMSNRPGRAQSGLKGVRASASGKRWRAYIGSADGTNGCRYLGTYGTPEEAHAAYQGAARILHGKFANMRVTVVGEIHATVQIMGVAA